MQALAYEMARLRVAELDAVTRRRQGVEELHGRRPSRTPMRGLLRRSRR